MTTCEDRDLDEFDSVDLDRLIVLHGYPCEAIWAVISASDKDVFIGPSNLCHIKPLAEKLKGCHSRCPAKLKLRNATGSAVSDIYGLAPTWCFIRSADLSDSRASSEDWRKAMNHVDIAHAIAVNFNMCFWDSADGSEFVVRAVATSRMIDDIIFLVPRRSV